MRTRLFLHPMTLVLTVGLLSILLHFESSLAQTPTELSSRARFQKFCRFVTDHTGWWEAPTDAADTANPFSAFYYESKLLPTQSGIHVSIHGRHRSGRLISFWDVIAYWNEKEQRADHLQLGSRGEIGTGQEKMIDSMITEIITKIVPPSGSDYTFRDYHTRISDSTMQSESSILDSLGHWLPQGMLNWKRCIVQIDKTAKQ